MEQENMTLDEMRRIVQEADDVEYVYPQAEQRAWEREQRAWEREQRAKAPEVRRRLKISCPLPSAATVSVMRFGVI